MKEVKFVEEIPEGLKEGRNKLIKEGKTVRVIVKRSKFYVKGKSNQIDASKSFKVIVYNR